LKKCGPGGRCDCALSGWIAPQCGPEKYRWAIDRLVEEFGAAAVRIAWENDYGRNQGIAVSPNWGEPNIQAAMWRLVGRHPLDDIAGIPRDKCRWYDLNDNRDDLDVFIDRARPMFRGFGL
jgi:hypothetical protein